MLKNNFQAKHTAVLPAITCTAEVQNNDIYIYSGLRMYCMYHKPDEFHYRMYPVHLLNKAVEFPGEQGCSIYSAHVAADVKYPTPTRNKPPRNFMP